MNLTDLVEEGFGYIARDHDGELYAFIGKPVKLSKVWLSYHTHRLIEDLGLDFIKWEDAEPYSIIDLIEEERKSTTKMYDRLQSSAQVKEQQRMWESSHTL